MEPEQCLDTKMLPALLPTLETMTMVVDSGWKRLTVLQRRQIPLTYQKDRILHIPWGGGVASPPPPPTFVSCEAPAPFSCLHLCTGDGEGGVAWTAASFVQLLGARKRGISRGPCVTTPLSVFHRAPAVIRGVLTKLAATL